jgi:hypothetical protein
VEDKIGEILDEITARAEQARLSRLECERLDGLYRQARARAVEAARERYVDDQKAVEAAAQATRWAEAERLRDFVIAMQQRSSSVADQDWLAWIRSHADQLDPPTQVPPEPPAIDLHEWELHAYLTRWPFDRPWGWLPS